MKNDRHFYQITVNGQLDLYWSTWFDGMSITWCDVAAGAGTARQTMLSGYVRDQAELYGILNKLRDLTLVLVRVERLSPHPAVDGSDGKGQCCLVTPGNSPDRL
jgi:hypothetical protein